MVNLIVDEVVIRGSDGIECFLFKKDSKKLNEIVKTLLMNLMIQNLELPLGINWQLKIVMGTSICSFFDVFIIRTSL